MNTQHSASTPGREWIPTARDLLIGGAFVAGEGESIEVVNPSTEEVLTNVRGASVDQVDQAVEAAQRAFDPWSRSSREERSRVLHRFCDVLEAHIPELLASIVNEVGTPVALAEFM